MLSKQRYICFFPYDKLTLKKNKEKKIELFLSNTQNKYINANVTRTCPYCKSVSQVLHATVTHIRTISRNTVASKCIKNVYSVQ